MVDELQKTEKQLKVYRRTLEIFKDKLEWLRIGKDYSWRFNS